MEARWFTRAIVAAAILAAALLHGSATAAAARPAIYVVPAIPPGAQAVGLYVAGAGGTISRRGAIASLERGKVENALLGGKPRGEVLVDLRRGTAPGPAVYVTLPPPGEHSNTKRYLVGISAPRFDGILTSDSTRIDGLVSIPDITQTAVALAEGRKADIRSVDGTRADLGRLDTRLARVHKVRGWTLTVVALILFGLAILRPRAGVVAGAASVAVALLLSFTETTRMWEVLLCMAGGTLALAYLASLRRRALPYVVGAFFLAFLLVLTLSPETSSLAVLGTRPDGGGRFYGVTNQVETLLLTPLIAAIAVGGIAWLAPLGALALLTIGWSEAGADGGGLIVYAVALAALYLRLRPAPLTWQRVAIAAGGVAVLVLALVGLDAALGGSSHVTHAVGTGPGSLLGDLGDRLHLSWASATKSTSNVVLFLASLAVLVWMGTRTPRRPAVDAMLVALAVSLLVNDTPVDVIGLGVLGCLALFRFESVDSRRMRRGALTAAFCVAAALAAAGCGSQGVTQAKPSTVVGTVAQAAPGKSIFTTQGCGSCHMYKPAGPEANGNIGPDLDKLPDYAKKVNQPVADFVHKSIVDPDAYVEKGYPKGVMPKSYASLPEQDLQDLVDFLSKPQG
ncbi:MAG: c-type cytochrome [Gaiellaceae bacterium]